MNEKIEVISTVDNIGIEIPDLRFNKTWKRKGTKVPIDKELLAQIMFDPGTDYMFRTGMLYIDDMAEKQELGLEPEGVEEPTNIIVLTDAQRKRYLTVMPVSEFKENFDKLSKEQKHELANYAIEHQISDIKKDRIIMEAIDVNIRRAIELSEDAKLVDKE